MYWVVYQKQPPYLLVIEIAFALLCCIAHDVPNDRGEKKNAGNEQHCFSFQVHKNK